MKRFLLCTDLDRTLLPNGPQPESPGARARFARLTACEDICLAYVTGRDLGRIRLAMREYALPRPDFVIADVGATICRMDEDQWRFWPQWEAHIAPDWRGRSADDLCALVRDLAGLRLQETSKQGRYKLSFYVPLDEDSHALRTAVHSRLRQAGLDVRLIWSIDEQAQVGLLDLLPVKAGKLAAIRFLRRHLGMPETVFAGDSGNDLDVFLSDVATIVVANAPVEITSVLTQAPNLYLAKGGYHGLNGNYSAGILEGVAHFWPQFGALV